MKLTLKPNIADPDGVYARLMAAHDGLTEEDSDLFSARLIFILLNHIGDPDLIGDAIDAAAAVRGERRIAASKT